MILWIVSDRLIYGGGGTGLVSDTPFKLDLQLHASKITVSNPYSLASLTKNLLFSSAVKSAKRAVTNMCEYGLTYIPDFIYISEIPSGHLPSDIDTSTASDWIRAFYMYGDEEFEVGLRSLPNPFYYMNNAVNVNYMFYYQRYIKDKLSYLIQF